MVSFGGLSYRAVDDAIARIQPLLLCLVTDVPDRPEQRGARRRGVLVASPGSLAVAANLAVRMEFKSSLELSSALGRERGLP